MAQPKRAKKGKTKNSLSLSLKKSKTKLFTNIRESLISFPPNHEEHTAPIIITDF